ncbi:MAG TPA: carbohydrate kinase family protein [Gaiellaceae bacterium]|nr:carbohydrate kinase family protein [Gaiellaceae bacterium]
MRLITVGDVMVDVVSKRLPAPGEHAHGSVRLRAGGSAVNAALTAAELGASAQVVGRIGADAAGELVVSTLEGNGIDAHLARDEELPTGTAVALADAVIADRGANALLSPPDLPSPLRADALLVSGFALFQEGSRDAARAALDRFDGEWPAVDLASPRLAALDFDAKVVFATEAEAQSVPGLEERFEIVCVKRVDGARARRGGQVVDVASPPVARTSPFGAGDAFAATFLVALASGEGLEAALERACAAGATAAGS